MDFQWQRIAIFVFFTAGKLLDWKLLLKIKMEECTAKCRRMMRR